MPDRSVVVFGDEVGLPRLLRLLPNATVRAAVRAATRPSQEKALTRLCSDAGVPLLAQPRPDAAGYPAFVADLQQLAPDIVVVDSYSMLLNADVLAIAPMGAFNVHGALLPAYRGANPTQWALLNDERETGVTIHCMTEEFDAGDIVGQRRVPIRFDDTWLDIHARVRQATEALLAEQLPRILDGSYERQPQDPDAARHFRRRRAKDGRIDWTASVLAIYNLIRALVAPNPGASYVKGDEMVVIDRYLTISEVAVLKHARPEVRPPSGTTLRLRALAEGGNEAVLLAAHRFEDDSEAGKVTVGDIDWDQRSARFAVDADDDVSEEIAVLAREFATVELGLTGC